MSASEICSLHQYHSPINLTIEDHHIVPQAWQHFWVPPRYLDGSEKAPYGGSGGLWDKRTAPICPSGHRNVHALLVGMMKFLAQGQHEAIDQAAAYSRYQVSGHRSERAAVLLALERFTAAGGKLLDLTAVHQWGEA